MKKYDVGCRKWMQLMRWGKGVELLTEESLTLDTVFFHGVIINSHGGHYERWIHLSTLDEVIGFLTYAFLPTAFYSIMNKENIFCMPTDCSFDEMIELLEEDLSIYKAELLPYMKVVSHQLDQLKAGTWVEKRGVLKTIERLIEQAFKGECSRLIGFQIFYSPLEVGECLVRCYRDDDLFEEDVIEQVIGFTQAQWLSICQEALIKRSSKQKFIEIMNQYMLDIL
ncbi:hypothetical protein PBV87_02935 [Niameybacter massiliensis]|uniref:Uncharacterized protein n=1 Tax=Holtiella tumoricola TaxID=3018743 RepID=A0AA42DK02_9FIRM|nr:hypothetical protein [Holtiella tumoricola]MDA3730461.1 hypothetical protein [Holtiella tumoricola]